MPTKESQSASKSFLDLLNQLGAPEDPAIRKQIAEDRQRVNTALRDETHRNVWDAIREDERSIRPSIVPLRGAKGRLKIIEEHETRFVQEFAVRVRQVSESAVRQYDPDVEHFRVRYQWYEEEVKDMAENKGDAIGDSLVRHAQETAAHSGSQFTEREKKHIDHWVAVLKARLRQQALAEISTERQAGLAFLKQQAAQKPIGTTTMETTDYLKQTALEVDKLVCVPGKETALTRFRKQIGTYLEQESERRRIRDERKAKYAQHVQAIEQDSRLRDRDAGPPESSMVWQSLLHPDEDRFVTGWSPSELFEDSENDDWLHGFCPKTTAEALPYYYFKLAVVHDRSLPNVPPIIDDKVLPPGPDVSPQLLNTPLNQLTDRERAQCQEWSRHFRYYLPLRLALREEKLSEFTGYDRDSIEMAFEHVRAHVEEAGHKNRGVGVGERVRLWTKHYCPSCGAPGLKWLSQSKFADNPGSPSRETIGEYVRTGRYCSDVQKRVPWCDECGVKTPEGTGDVLPKSEEQSEKEKAVFRLSSDEREALVNQVRSFMEGEGYDLPSDVSDPRTPKQGRAVEMLSVAVEAVLSEAARRKTMLSRDEVESIASNALSKARSDDVRAMKMSSGKLDYRTRVDKPESKSGRIIRKPIKDDRDDPDDE